MDTINYLLAQDGIDVNIQDDDGYTALMWAARFGHMEKMNILFARHDVDTSLVDKDRNTAAMLAKNNEIEKRILDHDAPAPATPRPTPGTPRPTPGTPRPTSATPRPTPGTPRPTPAAPKTPTPAPETRAPEPSTTPKAPDCYTCKATKSDMCLVINGHHFSCEELNKGETYDAKYVGFDSVETCGAQITDTQEDQPKSPEDEKAPE